MEKINVAELLKDCPKGMELYSTIYGTVYFDGVRDTGNAVLIDIKTSCNTEVQFYSNGKYNTYYSDSEITLFPSKNVRTWEGFVTPCKFKDGDVVYIKTKGHNHNKFIIIFKDIHNHACFAYQVLYTCKNAVCHLVDVEIMRLATEEEKQKLFDAIKANGYKWNAETKTLEKLIEPKFKVGDKVQHKGATSCGTVYEIEQIKWEDNQVKYIICNLYWKNCKCTVTAEDLQPYKEETMEERQYKELRMPLDDDDKLATEATFNGNKILPPNGYLIGKITQVDNGMLVEYVKKQPQYPKTYAECCEVLDILGNINIEGYKKELLLSLQQLLICRDAYWKIAGERMGLGKPWEPDWTNPSERKYCITNTEGNIIEWMWYQKTTNKILAFPTAEMRDAFYDTFEELIKECKELL